MDSVANIFNKSYRLVTTKISQFLSRFRPASQPPCLTTPKSPRGQAPEPQMGEEQQQSEAASPIAHAVAAHDAHWPKLFAAFCLTSAVEIALNAAQNGRLPLTIYFLSFSILLAFTSLFVAKCIVSNYPILSLVLERTGVFFAATAFYFTMTLSFPLCLKLISWAIYAMSLLAIVVCNRSRHTCYFVARNAIARVEGTAW